MRWPYLGLSSRIWLGQFRTGVTLTAAEPLRYSKGVCRIFPRLRGGILGVWFIALPAATCFDEINAFDNTRSPPKPTFTSGFIWRLIQIINSPGNSYDSPRCSFKQVVTYSRVQWDISLDRLPDPTNSLFQECPSADRRIEFAINFRLSKYWFHKSRGVHTVKKEKEMTQPTILFL